MVSRFTVSFNIDNDNVLMFSALSGSIVIVPTQIYNLLKQDKLSSSEPLFTQFKNAGFIAPENQDEFEILKQSYLHSINKKDSLGILLAPTLACNFDCPYCYENRNDTRLMDKSTFDNMSKYLVNEIKINDTKNVLLGCYGGEPLLYPEYFMNLHNIIFEQTNITPESILITNGSLLSKKIAELSNRLHLTNVQVTLHGCRSDHNKIRKFKNGSPSFDDILEGIKATLETNVPRITIRVNIDNENSNNLIYLFDQLSEVDLVENSRVQIVPSPVVSDSPSSSGYGKKCLNNSDYFEVAIKWFKLLISKKIVYDTKVIRNILKNQFVPQGLCGSHSKMTYIVAPDGSFGRCWNFIGDKEMALGNFNNQKKYFEEKLWEWEDAGLAKMNNCIEKKCPIIPMCGGGCFSRAFYQTGSIDNSLCPKTLSKLQLFLTRYANFCQSNNLVST